MAVQRYAPRGSHYSIVRPTSQTSVHERVEVGKYETNATMLSRSSRIVRRISGSSGVRQVGTANRSNSPRSSVRKCRIKTDYVSLSPRLRPRGARFLGEDGGNKPPRCCPERFAGTQIRWNDLTGWVYNHSGTRVGCPPGVAGAAGGGLEGSPRWSRILRAAGG